MTTWTPLSMMLRRGGVYILYLNLVRSLSPLTRPERACGVVHLSSDHMSDANVSYDPPFFLNYHYLCNSQAAVFLPFFLISGVTGKTGRSNLFLVRTSNYPTPSTHLTFWFWISHRVFSVGNGYLVRTFLSLWHIHCIWNHLFWKSSLQRRRSRTQNKRASRQ